MHTKRSEKEVAAEIKRLEKCKTYIPAKTYSGQSNIDLMDAVIGALANGISIDTAYEQFGDGDGLTREGEVIVDALLWRDGERDETPSSDWDSYKPNRKDEP